MSKIDNPIFHALTGVDVPEGVVNIIISIPRKDGAAYVLDGTPYNAQRGVWEGYYSQGGWGVSNPCKSFAHSRPDLPAALARIAAMVTRNKPALLAPDWAQRAAVKGFDVKGLPIYEKVFQTEAA